MLLIRNISVFLLRGCGYICINWLWPCDTGWRHGSWATLVQAIAFRLLNCPCLVLIHYLNPTESWQNVNLAPQNKFQSYFTIEGCANKKMHIKWYLVKLRYYMRSKIKQIRNDTCKSSSCIMQICINKKNEKQSMYDYGRTFIQHLNTRGGSGFKHHFRSLGADYGYSWAEIFS